MRELQLDSLHPDGEHLVLRDADGERYRIAIDEPLRVAVRRDRPHLEALRASGSGSLRPRDIQALIRAGASVEEVAATGGVAVESVRRYEGPVLAERVWMVEQTRQLPIGHEVGAPTLGDLVTDRLAARGVRGEIQWDAVRRPGEPWEVTVTFTSESHDGGADDGRDGSPDGEHRARWQVDLQARSLTALDDESRLLSETDLTARRGRAPFDVEAGAGRGADVVVRDSRTDGAGGSAGTAGTADPAGDPGAQAATDVLLDRLTAARGRRQPGTGQQAPEQSASAAPQDLAQGSGMGGDDALFPVAPVLSLRRPDAGEETPAGEAESGVDRRETEGADPDQADTPAPPPPTRKTGRAAKGRRTVPTWDEIVFGAKSD